MNVTWDTSVFERVVERLTEHSLHALRRCSSSTTSSIGRDAFIGRIHVINLDREACRWARISDELRRVRGTDGRPLLDVARRFSAVDARYLDDTAAVPDVETSYSLAEQLFVQPDPRLADRNDLDGRRIRMSRQELAVALSHVQVWRRVAEQDVERVLILEDDAYFARGFATRLDRIRAQLDVENGAFEVVYLSYKEAADTAQRGAQRGELFDPVTGVWQLSGYLLTREGAHRLLARLPVVGPVDLWMNHQFAELTVHAARRHLIRQRPGVASSNLYSVLPVLSELGSISRERPLLARPTRLPAPVFGYGPSGSGHGALAEALSMLGYRCCQDVSALDETLLFQPLDIGAFDAYVNVGSLPPTTWPDILRQRPNARFVLTTPASGALLEPQDAEVVAKLAAVDPAAALVLRKDHPDPWHALVDLLGAPYPTFPYPVVADGRQRQATREVSEAGPETRWLRADRSPWLVPVGRSPGLALDGSSEDTAGETTVVHRSGELDGLVWRRRDDTFPGNLSLFRADNVVTSESGLSILLRQQASAAREFTSGAIASIDSFLYGRFSAELRAPGTPGVVTGVFLHRNSPKQEIDIEILGREPTRMLTNVYFNPGCVGDRIEYGYRGSPAVVELGFDASAGFHVYEIEWRRDVIRWIVDGRVIHARNVWGPTPIPHRPMEFDVNLWPPRSRKLAGRLRRRDLPATLHVTRLDVVTSVDPDAQPATANGRA